MTMTTRTKASSRVLTTSLIDRRMKAVLSTGKMTLTPGGKVGATDRARALTASAVFRALEPGASWMARPAAGWRFTRVELS